MVRVSGKLEVMNLDELLTEIHSRRLIVTLAGVLWSPNEPIPMKLRQAVKCHRRALLYQLYRRGDVRLCPARDLHRRYYRHAGQGRFVCDMCLKLDASIMEAC